MAEGRTDYIFRAEGDVDLVGTNSQKDLAVPIAPTRRVLVVTFFRVAVVSGGGYGSYDIEVHDSGVGAAMTAATTRIKKTGVAPAAGLVVLENPDMSYADRGPEPNGSRIYVRVRGSGAGPGAKVRITLEGMRPRPLR